MQEENISVQQFCPADCIEDQSEQNGDDDSKHSKSLTNPCERTIYCIYLDSTIRHDGRASNNIKPRLNMIRNVLKMLSNVWRYQKYNIKLKFYQSYVLSTSNRAQSAWERHIATSPSCQPSTQRILEESWKYSDQAPSQMMKYLLDSIKRAWQSPSWEDDGARSGMCSEGNQPIPLVQSYIEHQKERKKWEDPITPERQPGYHSNCSQEQTDVEDLRWCHIC